MFLKIFPKIEFFFKRRRHVQDILKVSPCSKFHLDIKMTVIRIFIFQYTGYIIPTTKFKCMFWHVLNVAQENKWYHWISELKLHLTDAFFVAFSHIKNSTFFT